MSEPTSGFQLFSQGVAVVVLATLAGSELIRRSSKSRSHLQWSLGAALLIASIFAGLALAWLYLEVRTTESFGALIVLVAPSLPLAVIGLMTALSFCGCILWGAAHDRFVSRMGFLRAPGRSVVAASAGVLVIAATLGAYLILPIVHLLPYRALASDDRSGLKTLTAVRFNGELVPVVSVESTQWPEYNPSFRLSLDWRGRVVVDVRRTGKDSGETRTYFLPFRASTYRLQDGVPVRVD